MEQFVTQIPNTFTGWIITIILIVGSFSFYWNKTRAGDLKILRDTNSDQGSRIKLLEEAIIRLTKEVEDLKHQNKTLEDLVVVALKQFFFENPEMAKELKDKINL